MFGVVDHCTAEAWAHVAKTGDRFAALQPVYDAVIDRFGGLVADVACGIALRHDWGPQYRSAHFLGSIAWLGIADDAASWASQRPTAAPSAGSAPSRGNACGRSCTTPSTTSPGRGSFLDAHNSQWLIGRLGHRTPKEAYQDAIHDRGGMIR